MIDLQLKAVLEGKFVGTTGSCIRRVENRQIGMLAIPSGRIVACDPFLITQPASFALQVPTGRFPIRLFILHYEPEDQRIAAVRLEFADGIPDRWEMALMPGQDVSTLEPDHFFGYPVDSGTGSFMDLRAAECLEARMDADETYYEGIIKQMNLTYVHTRSWAVVDLEGQQGLNAAVFSSGVGDGVYPSYWGWSGSRLLCLVTDFSLLYSEEG